MQPAVEALFGSKQLALIAGPCVIESEQLCMDVAGRVAELTRARGIPFIFKASFDKANRTALTSFRGPGMDAGLTVLANVRNSIERRSPEDRTTSNFPA